MSQKDDKDFYEETPTKHIENFTINDKPKEENKETQSKQNKSAMKKLIDSTSLNYSEDKLRSTKVDFNIEKNSEKTREPRRKKTKHSHSLAAENFREKDNNFKKMKNINNVKGLYTANIKVFIDNINVAGIEFNRSLSNKNPAAKLFNNILHKHMFNKIKNNNEMLKKQHFNVDVINKQFNDCFSVFVDEAKSKLHSENFLNKSLPSDNLPRMNFKDILNQINKYLDDQMQNKLRHNRFLDKEPSKYIEKTSFTYVNDIINEYLAKNNINETFPFHEFLEKNSNRLLDKTDFSSVLKEIEDIVNKLNEPKKTVFSFQKSENIVLKKSTFNDILKNFEVFDHEFNINISSNIKIEKSNLNATHSIISNLQQISFVHLGNTKEVKHDLNDIRTIICNIPNSVALSEEHKDISVDDLNQIENSNNQKSVMGYNLQITNPFAESNEIGDVHQHCSFIDPNDEGIKSNVKTQKNSVNYDENNKLESYKTPSKGKRQTPDKSLNLISADPKHQYVSNKLRRTLSVFLDFHNEVDQIASIPMNFQRRPTTNLSTIKKLKQANDSLDRMNTHLNKDDSKKRGITKSLNFESIFDTEKKDKDINKSNSVFSIKKKVSELDLETSTPRFQRTDLISKLLSYSEDELKNLAMKNVPPQEPLPKQKPNEINNLKKYVFASNEYLNKESGKIYICDNQIKSIGFKEIEKNSTDNKEIPRYKSHITKYKSTINFSYKKQEHVNYEINSVQEIIPFKFCSYPKDEKNINIDYSLTESKVKKLIFNINISNKCFKQVINISSNISSINISSFLKHKPNRLSYSFITKIILFVLKDKFKEEVLTSIALNLMDFIKKIENHSPSTPIKEISFETMNNIILNTFNLIDIMCAGIKEYCEINKEIKSEYLNLHSLEHIRFLSVIDGNRLKHNIYSIFDIASFIYSTHKITCRRLKDINEINLDMKNKLRNELGRLHDFSSYFNPSYFSKLDNLYKIYLETIKIIKEHCLKLQELKKEIEEYDKDLPHFLNNSCILESGTKHHSAEKIRNFKSLNVYPIIAKDLCNNNTGKENKITYKLNNFDKKNLKKKQIIENLRAKEIDLLGTQIVKEGERYIQLEKDRDALMEELKKKRFCYLDWVNYSLVLLIIFVFFVIIRYLYIKLRVPQKYPVESFTNE